MADIKVINNISEAGLDIVRKSGYTLTADPEDPVGIYMRSANILDYQFNPSLLAIARSGVGVNNIPVDRCTENGIAVFNTPGANAAGVKELVIGVMIMIARDVIGSMRWCQTLEGDKESVTKQVEKGKVQFVGPEVGGKTIGVIGLGAVGSGVANACLDLGMKVYGYDPYLTVEAAWRVSSDVIRYDSLEAMLPLCDYVTIHTPATNETIGMLGARNIKLMKDGVKLINFARQEVAVEEDIIAGLESGKIDHYACDFPSPNLIGRSNVILTPHLGGSTEESEINCAVIAAKELVEYLKTGNIKNSVNLPTVNLERMGVCRLCVIHDNVPRMINRFLNLISVNETNVEHMINKAAGNIAYTIIDLDEILDESIIKEIADMKEVKRVRTIEY